MRTKKAFWNMASSLLYQVVATVCGLITPRLILAAYGSTYNGVISSVTQFLSMISILTLGITGATRLALYKPLANKDAFGISRIMRATEKYMRKVALILIIYVIVLSVIYPYISHNDLSANESRILVAIVGIGTFAEFFFGITSQTLLTADQSSYVINLFHLVKTTLNTVLVVILIRMGASIFVVKLGSSTVYFIVPFIQNLYVRKKYKLQPKCEPDDEAIKQRGAIAIHAIANFVHNNTDLTLFTLFTDAKIISVYTVYYLVIGKIKTLMQVITNGMEAAFGNMWVKKEHQTLERTFSTYEYMLYAFTVFIFSCVGILILPFIAVYTRGVEDVTYVNQSLALLITVTEALYCVRHPYLTLVYATGFYEETKAGAVMEAVLNVLVSLVLINIIGLPGVVVGTLVAHLYRTIQFALFVSRRILHRSISVVIKRAFWSVASIGVIVACKHYLIDSFIAYSNTWISWVINAAVTSIVAAAVTVISSLVFYRTDFLHMCNSLKRVFRKRIK